MRVVKFTKNFANKKKDEEFKCSSSLANQLVRHDKVAKYVEEKKK